MAIEKRLYFDPLDILIQDESRTCKGCVFEMEAFNTKYCDKGKCHGKRCKLYKEAINGVT